MRVRMDDVLWTPPSFSISDILGPLDYDAMNDPFYRRHVCANNPITYALTYLKHHLRSPETGNRLSLSQLHIDLAAAALDWRTPAGLRESRRIWVAPRDSGKSTWSLVILPLWALSFNYIKFPALFSDGGDQSARHFRTLKRELEDNPLLINDFPELCTPATRRGNRSDVDNSHEYHSSGGHTILAKGIDAKTLGLKAGTTRPDFLGFDDAEPHGARYSQAQKAKRLATITEAILPMNLYARVEMVGTSTMYNSIIHDAVIAATGGKVADWIEEEGFSTRYYPAVMTDESGREVSLWPQKWSIEEMQAMRRTRSFAMNFMNMPVSNSNGFWEHENFQYNFPWEIVESVLVIDPALTSRETSDFTGIAVVGTDAARRGAVVEYAVGVRLGPKKVREIVHFLLMNNPTINTVILEKNAGADYVAERLMPWPRPVQFLNPHESQNKVARIGDLHDYYERGWVWHRSGLVALQDDMLAYPDVDHDDTIDAVARGVDHYLRGKRAA